MATIEHYTNNLAREWLDELIVNWQPARIRAMALYLFTVAYERAVKQQLAANPDMPEGLMRSTMRMMWNDGTLRTDEDMDYGNATFVEREYLDVCKERDAAIRERDELRALLAKH